jgi:ATP-binding cassette subfamily F protein 3
MLHITTLTYRIGGRTLFDEASVSVAAGQRVGLVGRNGAGKTTLFRLLLGEAQADGGSVTVRRGARVGTVPQEAPDGPQSLIETVLAADDERAALLAEAETAKDGTRIAEIHTRLTDIEAHGAPARAAAILAGLGFDEEAQQRPCGDFSGGWRMRVALAGALFARPELLLLDEPTNHLDLEAALWLESYLAAWPGTLMVISHDRTLLNQSVDGIIHLRAGKLTRYAGTYDRFERTRREQLAVQTRMQTKQQAERQRIQGFVDRFRAQANKARQAQSRLKMLARMEPIATVMEERTVSFDFPEPKPLAPPLIALDGVAVGYEPGKPVLRNLGLRIDMDDRIALIGANGNGKSTLVKLLAGRLKHETGRQHQPGKLRIGYFAQHQADELDLESTPLDHMIRCMPDTAPVRVRAHLGAFGFAQEKAEVRVEDLSGGEKARLLFALMSIEAPHIMLLDEPTNHLDVNAREALVQALNAYEGAVILVSHDAHLIDLVCDRLWLVDGGTCTPFDGDLTDYRNRLLEQRRGERRAARGNGGQGRRDQRRQRAQARAETAVLRRTAKTAEARLENLNKRREALETRLADPAVYTGPTAALQELQVELGTVKQAIAETEHAWLEALETIEAAG